MRARNHLHADDIAQLSSSAGTGVDGRFDSCHVTDEEAGDETAADLFPAEELDVRGLEGSVRRFDEGDETFGLDHAQGFHFGHSSGLQGVGGEGGLWFMVDGLSTGRTLRVGKPEDSVIGWMDASAETAEDSAESFGGFVGFAVVCIRDEPLSLGDGEVRDTLHQRTECDLNEVGEILARSSAKLAETDTAARLR